MKKLSPARSGTTQVLKAARKRIDSTLEMLKKTHLGDKDVHDARKALKKARAALRLLQPGLKDSIYRRENLALRDAARPLSTVRDAKVLLDTLSMVVASDEAPATAPRFDGLQRVLKHHRTATNHSVLEAPAALAHSRRLLRKSRTEIAAQTIRRKDWDVLGPGLRHIYAKGRRAMSEVRDRPTPGAFHEWRKQVKYLRYALAILEPVCPGLIAALVDEAHRLADSLGDNHDLNVLKEMARANPGELSDDSLDVLVALIERRQEKLHRRSLAVGSRLFDEQPKVFARRIGQRWQQWRDT